MSKDKNQLTLLEQILDSKIEALPTLPTQQRFSSKYMILVKSNELYYAIGSAINQFKLFSYLQNKCFPKQIDAV